MYQFEDTNLDCNASRYGNGKTPERIVFDTIPVGKQARIPKSVVPDGSLRAWGHTVGKERGIRFSVRSDGADWIVAAFERIPTLADSDGDDGA